MINKLKKIIESIIGYGLVSFVLIVVISVIAILGGDNEIIWFRIYFHKEYYYIFHYSNHSRISNRNFCLSISESIVIAR